MKYSLVLIRHGESTWNNENRFTGWEDVPLSAKGVEEARAGGKLIKASGLTFDLAYTSLLKRAINTLWIALEECDLMWIPVQRSWRLNERHYGALTGMDKQETVNKHGIEQVTIWRRSYDIPPPPLEKSSPYYPGNDRRYADVPENEIPLCESLLDTKNRFLVEWEKSIVPEIKRGKRLIISAHGNTLRALVQHLDDIPSSEITELNIPTAIPLVYELDENLKPIPHPLRISPLNGYYLGNQDEIKARILGVKQQTK
jgi:2,3-bisphosphoglycerate-dependent phosphoglycerate mutase